MSDGAEKDVLTRRGFLGVSSAVLAAAGMRSVENLAPQEPGDYKSKAERRPTGHGRTTNPQPIAAPAIQLPQTLRWTPRIRTPSRLPEPMRAECRPSSIPFR